MLLSLIPLVISRPIIKESLQAVVTPVLAVSKNQLDVLPTRDLTQLLTVRPGVPVEPIERSTVRVFNDRARTATDIDSLFNLEQVEVLRGPQGTLFGRAALDELGRTLFAELGSTVKKFEGSNPTIQFDPLKGIQTEGYTQWTLTSSYKDLMGNAEIFRLTQVGNDPPTRVSLGSKPIYLGTYRMPDPPKMQYFADTMPSQPVFDALGGVRFSEDYASKLGVSQLSLPFCPRITGDNLKTSPMEYFSLTSAQYGQDRVNGWLKNSGLEFGEVTRLMMGAAGQGESMSSLRFPGDPMAFTNTKCGSDVFFPGGTIWMPDTPGYQALMSTSPFRYKFMLFASIDGGAFQTGEMITRCLNMHLSEPAKGVRYFPFAPATPVLSALAKIEDRSSIRGFYDQPRVWVYTDKASMEEINGRLFPKIMPGKYVNVLNDVVRVGGFTSKDLLLAKIFNPTLLLANDSGKDSFAWFSEHLLSRFGKETATFIGSNAGVGKLLTSGEKADQTHAIRLVNAVLGSDSAESRLALLKLLASSDAPALKGQVGDLRPSLYSADSAEVELALAVSEKYQTARPAEALRYLAAQGPNDAIKQKAKSLLGTD